MAKNEARIKFSADTQEFTSQITKANSTLATLRSALALNDAEFKNTGNSAEYLRNKQAALSTMIQQSQEKQEALNGKLQAAEAIYGKNSTEAENWRTKLNKAATEEEKLQQELSKTNRALEQQEASEKEAQTPLAQLNAKIKDQREELQKLKKEYANTALAEGKDSAAAQELKGKIDALNRELSENERELNEVTEATNKMSNAEQLSATKCTFFGNMLGNLASSGLQTLIGKLKEGAQQVINLGTEFTSSLSYVQALSGASESEMEKLEAKAKSLGRSTIYSAKQVSDAFGYMSLAGWETEDMLDGIDGVLDLAASSGMDLAEASDLVTDYLSAFGLEAKDTKSLVDMLSYAQAHSNTTTEQLGEAYGNCAASAHTAGQSVQTTTAILEGWANQGLKGAEAGTAFSAMVRDITQKMKDGKIMIGDTAITVQDANGNFRSMTDILKDVETATNGMGSAEKSAALMTTFTARSVKGVSMALTEGVDNLKDYESALDDCSGTASEMTEIMNDNLAGDMKELNSAAEGLGLALFEYFEGPLRSAAQTAADALNWITDAITPQKSTLESFIEDIAESNRQVRGTIENAQSVMDDATSSIAELEAYKQILIDLNSKSELTEFEQYQLKDAVDKLSESVPGLKDAYDETNGVLTITNEELESMIQNAEDLALKNAIIEAQEGAYKALAQATIDVAKAQSALEMAQATHDEEIQRQKDVGILSEKYEDYGKSAVNASHDVNDAQKVLDEANQNLEDAQKEIDITNDALSNLSERTGKTTEELKKETKATEEATEAGEEFALQTEEEIQAQEEAAKAAEEAAKKIQEAYENMRDGIEKSMKDSVSFMNEFSGGAEITAQEIEENLDSQIEGISKWSENMQRLGKEAGTGMSQEMYDALVEMGPSAANLVQELVDTLETDEGKFKEISDKYAKALELSDTSETLASYTKAGKDAADAAADGMTSGSPEVEAAAKKISNVAKDGTDFSDIGKKAADASKDTESGLAKSVLATMIQTALMKSAAESGATAAKDAMQSAMSGIPGQVQATMNSAVAAVQSGVEQMRAALNVTLRGPYIQVPHFSMVGSFDAKTNSVPYVSVDWWAKGGIFTRPTIIPTMRGMQGVGEAGPEAVLPIELMKEYVAEAVEAAEANQVNVYMTVNGAESPEGWAADFARQLRMEMRMG